MIITDESKLLGKSGKAAEAASERQESVPDDLPPPYAEPEASSSNIAPPSFVKPSNFVTVSRLNGSINSTYVIDPSLRIPLSLLPALPSGETSHRNLDLQSKNGSVQADISLPSVEAHGKRVTIYMKSWNGRVEATIHRPFPAPAVHLTASSLNGRINISLPRSFHGLIVARTLNGSIKFTPALTYQQTLFSEMSGTHKCFIGDVTGYMEKDGHEWEGDEVIVDTKNGSVKFQFDDDVAETPVKGFFAKVWDSLL